MTFYRLCSCKDRATVRHRPNSRKKNPRSPISKLCRCLACGSEESQCRALTEAAELSFGLPAAFSTLEDWQTGIKGQVFDVVQCAQRIYTGAAASTSFFWSAPVAFRRVALETPEWTSRDSNHHRQSVSAGETNAIPTEPLGRLGPPPVRQSFRSTVRRSGRNGSSRWEMFGKRTLPCQIDPSQCIVVGWAEGC